MKKFLSLSIIALSLVSLASCGGGGKKTFTFTYYMNDGTSEVYETKEFNKNSYAEHPEDPTRSGYTFGGWYSEAECQNKYSIATLVTEDVELYAKWATEQSGNGGSSSSDVSQQTYTFTQLPDWVTNDGCVLFAWIWEQGAEGSWVTCEYSSLTECTFKTDKNIVGALIARCAPGTTTPDWSVNTDIPGRVYNKSMDVTVTSGVTSYTCSTWYDYYPGN
jgi:uncharacterized repeat protein (TIGR02543 family)